MTKAEVAKILTIIASFDRRTIGEADVEAWYLILGDIDAQDGAQAVRDHYAEKTTWIMPADVRGAAIVIDRRRRGAIRQAEIQAELQADRPQTGPLTLTQKPIDRTMWPSVPPLTRSERDPDRMAAARAEIDSRRTARTS